MKLLLALVSALVLGGVAVAAPPKQAAQLTGPFGAIVEPRGTLLVPDGASGRIVRVDPRTGRRTVYAKGLGRVYVVAYGPDGLYAGTATKVVRFSGGKRSTVLSGLHDAAGLAVAKDGTIFVAEETGNRVLRFDAGSRKRTVIAADGIDQPLGLVLATDGSVLVADSRHHRIVRIGQDGTVETALDGLGLPIGLAAAPDGTVLVADHVDHLLRGNILRLHADGTTDTVSGGKIRGLSGVAVARNGTLYATSFYAPFVGTLNASGALKAFPAPR